MVSSGASALRASVALKRSLAMTRRKANELGYPFRTNAELRKERSRIFIGDNVDKRAFSD
jgi:hypothetical protein